jgi:hypothetical protein
MEEQTPITVILQIHVADTTSPRRLTLGVPWRAPRLRPLQTFGTRNCSTILFWRSRRQQNTLDASEEFEDEELEDEELEDEELEDEELNAPVEI